jgi:hypothetical protein
VPASLFSYVVDHDFGFAPNPKGDYYTLVHCKFGGRAGHKNIVELAAAAIAKKHGASVMRGAQRDLERNGKSKVDLRGPGSGRTS